MSTTFSFVTDVEGNWDYWCRFVERSAALHFAPGVPRSDAGAVGLSDGFGFVYGGDVFDKGPGDLRVGGHLVSLKERYPDRVFLVMGNRDINKMRFTAELADSDISRPLDDIPGPFWVKKEERVTPRMYLERIVREKFGKDIDGPEFEDEVQKINTKVNRLKWMLEHTLGSASTFEYRRTELKILLQEQNHSNDAEPTDDDVLRSMLTAVQHPAGVVRRYLELASLAVIIGDTLFVHGAVEPASAGWIPNDDHPYAVIDDGPGGAIVGGRYVSADLSAAEWVDELNAFARRSLEDWSKRPHFNEARTTRGGEALIAYQSRPAMHDRTVTVSSYSFGGNMPLPADRGSTTQVGAGNSNTMSIIDVSDPLNPTTVAYLAASGITRVIVGHKPSSDSPAVMSYAASLTSAAASDMPANGPGLEVICADNSYSDPTASDNRGPNAWCEVLVERFTEDNSSRARIRGALRDAALYDNALSSVKTDGVGADGDPWIGHVVRYLPEGKNGALWWVKANVPGRGYLISRGERRHDVFQKFVQSADHLGIWEPHP